MNIEATLKQTYDGKKVLITGHTGFKGGWLALWLESLGAKIIGYSLDPPTDPSFFQETALSNRIIDLRGDILDQPKIYQVVNKYRPDFIFHLAAQPLVRSSYTKPYETFNVNIMGTVNVLESIRLSKIPTTCVCITSDKCYENKEWEYAYRENDHLGGHDPYSASKGAAELVIASYRKSFFGESSSEPLCALSSARAGNIIGGGDWAEDRLVPDCVRSLDKGEPIKIRNRSAIRPWQFVLDPLFGYLCLGIRMKENPKSYTDAWNFGPCYSNAIDVKTLTEKIIHYWGNGEWEDQSQNNDSLHEARYLKLDITKSISKLGWRPINQIEGAIHKTIEWYKSYYSKSVDMNTFSLEQIKDFMECYHKEYN